MAPEPRLLAVLSRRLLGRARVVSDPDEIGDDRPQASLPVFLPGQLAHLKKAKATKKREVLQTTTGLASVGLPCSPLFYRSLSLVTYRREIDNPPLQRFGWVCLKRVLLCSPGLPQIHNSSASACDCRFPSMLLPQPQLSQLPQLLHLWPRPSS